KYPRLKDSTYYSFYSSHFMMIRFSHTSNLLHQLLQDLDPDKKLSPMLDKFFDAMGEPPRSSPSSGTHETEALSEVLPEFLDPITHKPMTDPVMVITAKGGRSYERSSIEPLIDEYKKFRDPITGELFLSATLVSNEALKKTIKDYPRAVSLLDKLRIFQ